MECSVLYEGWQMECCGKPFTIGDIVRWPVVAWKKQIAVSNGESRDSDYAYEAHGDSNEGLYILQGVVYQIDVLYTVRKPSDDDPRLMLPFSDFFVTAEKADGKKEEIDGADFDAYIVSLKNIEIRPVSADEPIL